MQQSMYVDVSNAIIEVLPADWNKFVLFTKADGDDHEMLLYYYPEGSDTPMESSEIPSMDQEALKAAFEKGWGYMKSERDVLKSIDSNYELWTFMAIAFDAQGHFRAKYDFKPVAQMDEAFMEEWKKNYLVP